MEINMVTYSPCRHCYEVELGSVLMSSKVLLVQTAPWHAIVLISRKHWYLASFRRLPLPRLRHFHWSPWSSLAITRIHGYIEIHPVAVCEGPSGHAALYDPGTLCQNTCEASPGCSQSPRCISQFINIFLYFHSSLSRESLTLRIEEGKAWHLKAWFFLLLTCHSHSFKGNKE